MWHQIAPYPVMYIDLKDDALTSFSPGPPCCVYFTHNFTPPYVAAETQESPQAATPRSKVTEFFKKSSPTHLFILYSFFLPKIYPDCFDSNKKFQGAISAETSPIDAARRGELVCEIPAPGCGGTAEVLAVKAGGGAYAAND